MIIKPYTDSDFPEYLRLRNELDIHGQVESEDDQRTALSLPWMAPERDILMVFDGAAAVGYARANKNTSPDANRHFFNVSVAERFQDDRKLIDDLIARCEARIAEIAKDYGDIPLRIRTGCYDEETWFADAAERNGYELIRYYARMDLNDLVSLQEPTPPEGVKIRKFERDAETPELVDVFNRGFEGHFEHEPESLDNFEVYLKTHWYQPENVFVAETGGELVGVNWNYLNPEPEADGLTWGIVEDIAVVPEWRGKGLGRALIRGGQLTLRAAGAERICLWVDYANPFGAKKLYYSEGYVDRYISRSYAKDE
ncbi:MAG: GNAT family N-acetyltransferase [Candidatus Coatesbacteria bacterium]|nr:MAG: GNAT family N-acetyltransferase [Candidatus Coatesbacteria bacterium]